MTTKRISFFICVALCLIFGNVFCQEKAPAKPNFLARKTETISNSKESSNENATKENNLLPDKKTSRPTHIVTSRAILNEELEGGSSTSSSDKKEVGNKKSKENATSRPNQPVSNVSEKRKEE